jgi:hypothetical protein
MSAIPPNDSPVPESSYADEAAAVDQILDECLAEIRRRTDAGDITVREAADERVLALERHIETIRNLRAEYLGEGSAS